MFLHGGGASSARECSAGSIFLKLFDYCVKYCVYFAIISVISVSSV